MKPVADHIFKPVRSRFEALKDATAEVAQQIIDTETAIRLAKTERLRMARLARESLAEPLSGAKKAKASRRKIRRNF